MERFALFLKNLRHGLLNKLPVPIYFFARKATFKILYLLNWKGRSVKVAGQYPLQVKWERAAVDFATWEAEFTSHFGQVLSGLNGNKTVIDIGASIGEWSALAASIVGSENIHVFEPDKASWNDINQIFRLNSLPVPGGIFQGFAANKDSFRSSLMDTARSRKWPAGVRGESRFESLLEATNIPSIKLDTYCHQNSVRPSVVKIDVEGAEGEVLRGSKQLFESHHPILFLSLHPEMVTAYGDTRDGLLQWVEARGYKGKLLGTDHEEHWLFVPEDENVLTR